MHWCQIDESYLNFLREYESRIPYMDYGGNHYKPFFHSLFTLENGLEYVAQLNHAQKRHKRMRDMRLILNEYLYLYVGKMET